MSPMRLRFLPVLMLTACAALEPGADQVMALDAIVGETVQASRAPAAEQKAALGRAQSAFVKEAIPLNRVRLAALLLALPAPHRDDARAAELLEPIADAGARGPGRLAALLLNQLHERQRLARELERISRERATAERERASAERERVATDRERDKREEALKQQLDALRSIERSILEREEKLRRKPR